MFFIKHYFFQNEHTRLIHAAIINMAFQEYGDSYKFIDQPRDHMRNVITALLKPSSLFPWLKLICRITEVRHGVRDWA